MTGPGWRELRAAEERRERWRFVGFALACLLMPGAALAVLGVIMALVGK